MKFFTIAASIFAMRAIAVPTADPAPAPVALPIELNPCVEHCGEVMDALKRGARAAEIVRTIKVQMKVVEAVAALILRGGTCDC